MYSVPVTATVENTLWMKKLFWSQLITDSGYLVSKISGRFITCWVWVTWLNEAQKQLDFSDDGINLKLSN